jgi:hypothetical protein
MRDCFFSGDWREVLKSVDVLRGSKAFIFQYIAEYRVKLSCGLLCRLMGVSER